VGPPLQRGGWFAIVWAAGLSLAAPASQGGELLVFAAASLSDALEEIVAQSGKSEVRTVRTVRSDPRPRTSARRVLSGEFPTVVPSRAETVAAGGG
jgi:hypothetical protein